MAISQSNALRVFNLFLALLCKYELGERRKRLTVRPNILASWFGTIFRICCKNNCLSSCRGSRIVRNDGMLTLIPFSCTAPSLKVKCIKCNRKHQVAARLWHRLHKGLEKTSVDGGLLYFNRDSNFEPSMGWQSPKSCVASWVIKERILPNYARYCLAEM